MKNIIIGTAGHIDHGKTTLIRALTGRNTDRLKEEQKRGISIELGFTHFDLDENTRVGIIDVPGHEKFIKNMLSGVSGMDMVALVVAADEGVMPQTREHIDILNLIGIKVGLIVLTKCDLVDRDWIELVKLDILDELEGTFLEHANIVEVSSTTNQGIDELKSEIAKLIELVEVRDINSTPRIYVDRSFSITGFGTVITGTLTSGSLNIDDELFVYPSKKETKIRNLQVHDNDVKTAFAGQRVAINLANIKKEDVPKGSVLVPVNSYTETSIIDVKIKTLNLPFNIENRTRFHLYLGSNEVLCRAILLDEESLESNKEYIIQLRLEEPILCKRNDKFILRLFSPLYTIGGGYIIDSNAIKKKRFKNESESIKKMDCCTFEEYVFEYINRFSQKFLGEKDYYSYFSESKINVDNAINDLINENKIIVFGIGNDRLLLTVNFIDNLRNDIISYLQDFHNEFPKRIGILKETVKAKYFDSVNGKIKTEFMNYIFDQNFNILGDYISLSDFNIVLDDSDNKIIENIINKFNSDKYSILTIDELIDAKNNELKELMVYLISIKKVMKLDTGYMLKENYDNSVRIVREYIEKNGSIALGDARDILNSNRKSTMELLEFYDKEKITIRKDTIRILA